MKKRAATVLTITTAAVPHHPQRQALTYGTATVLLCLCSVQQEIQSRPHFCAQLENQTHIVEPRPVITRLYMLPADDRYVVFPLFNLRHPRDFKAAASRMETLVIDNRLTGTGT